MLDSETKRRIDTARDILVGKVPDPKSQVEQITIALIYKFMDDMDAESEELGGKRKFFTGKFAEYGWPKLMHSGLGGHEVLNKYAEAISKMPENPGIPPLFRDIFKNAYLPYRAPETLKSFLKIIDGFTYDHSEKLGDAFEYLLSVLGSQGDAGQFRTPRHIIDFIVDIVNPKKGEVVLDPACGTAGFLISAYKHILKTAKDGKKPITPDERGKLAKNFKGYDISPDMVRLSLVNLYLHGFTDPHIYEYDSLTSEDRWNEYADVILANPPFMSPKGGIRPHKKFSIDAKRSEVLFVDYIAEHLTPNGRAGIIVPEGIIFQSGTAYKQLRKMLVETSLVAVISLPAGMFNPYSGVKTSVLILDKALAKQSDTIGFFKIDNDGFGLGAQRRASEKNDIPRVKDELHIYLNALRTGSDPGFGCGLIVTKSQLAVSGDYSLSGERYRTGAISKTDYPLVPISSFLREQVKTVDPRTAPEEIFELWSIPAFDAGQPELISGGEIGSQKKVVYPDDVLLSKIIPHIRRGWVVKENSNRYRQVASTEWIVFASDKVVPEYLREIIVSDFFHKSFMQTLTGIGGSLTRANPEAVGQILIPLPPVERQREIVAEIEGYQKIISGARTVLNSYRPQIPVHLDWKMVRLGDVCSVIMDGTHFSPSNQEKGDRLYLTSKNVRENYLDLSNVSYISEQAHQEIYKRCRVRQGDVLYVKDGANTGLSAINILEEEFSLLSSVAVLRGIPDQLDNRYLSYFLNTGVGRTIMLSMISGVAITRLTLTKLNSAQIPLPPLAAQQAIVAEIEVEQALVAANRELITRFERKIQEALARIWGD